MTLDIQPEIRIATDLDKVILKTRELDSLVWVELADGREYSVRWDNKGLAEFQPNKTVSEMIAEWEAGVVRNYELYLKAYESNIHPFWTRSIISPNSPYGRREFITVPYEMNKHEKDGMLRVAEQWKARMGKMKCVKLVLN